MTRTSKMPGLSYSLPAWACKTGAKLRKIPGTPCHGCYALKGNYIRYPAIKKAQYYRLDSLGHDSWVTAMVAQIKRQKWFRWHDAGDLQSADHLRKIFEVCRLTPGTQHWLPTQERKYLPLGSYPDNLTIRLRNAKNNTAPGQAWTHWSTVVDYDAPIYGATVKHCPASKQGNQCKSCRSCWSRDVKHVTYPKH